MSVHVLRPARRLRREARARAGPSGEARERRRPGLHLPRSATAIAGRTAIRSRPRTSATTGRTSRTTKELSPAGMPEFMLRRRQAAPLRDPRRAHGPLQLGQAEPALPAAARRPARPLHLPAGPLPEAVPRQVRRQGEARGAARRSRSSSPGRRCTTGSTTCSRTPNPDLPTLQAWRVTNAAPATRFTFERNPYYHRVDAAGQQLPYVDRVDHRRRGRRPHGREGECRRDRPPVPRPVDGRHPDPQGGRARQGLQDPALAERPRQRARALSEPQRRRPGLADAEPRRALPPRPVARHRPQDAEQRAPLRPRHGGQQHDHGGERAVLAGAAHAHTPATTRRRPRGSSTRSG